MTDDRDLLRARAREAIAQKRLPNRRPDRTWGGPGAGAACAICGVPMDAHDLEIELEFIRRDGGGDHFHVHARCFAMWELERKRPWAAAPASDGRGQECPLALLSERRVAGSMNGPGRSRPDETGGA